VAAADGDAGAAIRTQVLTKEYPGGVTAVDGLDLTVRANEIFGLLGPNGAGKTTTVGMLTTRIVPTAGAAWIAGTDVVADPAGARAACGVLSQGNTLDRGLSTRDNLYFHGRYFGMGAKAARAAADQWLERFRLGHRARAPVGALSGGMARRLMLARALMHEPDVLFLDEPTAGLDPQSRLGLWEIIAEMRTSGQTVFLTTHYMEEADQLCDRVAIMDHGHILALDTPARLKAAGSSGATATISLVGSGDRLRLTTALDKLGGVTVTTTDDGVLRLQTAGDRPLARIVSAAERCGYTVGNVSTETSSLETVFIDLTGRGLRE
jgi:ABC-2 type transport system ATP-binding protein